MSFNFFKRGRASRVTFEEQLAILERAGISLAPSVTPDALLLSYDREAFESQPFALLLSAMGTEAEVESQAGPSGYPSDNIWCFDTECIEVHGDYATIALRMAVLAQGSLPLEDVQDHVDTEANEAWLSFRLDGKAHRWDFEVNDDWVDPAIIERLQDLLVKRGTGRRFINIHTYGGQEIVIACSTPAQVKVLRVEAGLKVLS
jgi:hypothetical protein